MKVCKEEASGAIEEGVYTARVNSIDEKEGKWGTFLSWSFQIDDEESEYDGRIVLGMTPAKWAEGEKTDKWLQAFGINARVGEEFDLDELVGQRVQIMVQNKVQGDREYSNVISLKPATKKKPAETPSSQSAHRSTPNRPGGQHAPSSTPRSSQRVKDDEDNFSFD